MKLKKQVFPADARLSKKLSRELGKVSTGYMSIGEVSGMKSIDDDDDEDPNQIFVQWTTTDNRAFFPAARSVGALEPGLYEIRSLPNGGLYYERVAMGTEGLLRFPETASQKVVNEIETFWEREEMFVKHRLAFKRGMLLYGPPGCHAKGTGILMFDGTVKKVEDVKVGDRLMGPDSKPRTVKYLCRGKDQMFRITPNKGESFVVNGHHILSLQRSGWRLSKAKKLYDNSTIENISVNDYLKLSNDKKHHLKLRHVGIDFGQKHNLSIDPYFLGLWLGDGTGRTQEITTADSEIINYIYSYANGMNLNVSKRIQPNNLSSVYNIKNENSGKKGFPRSGLNALRTELKKLDLFNNKHIPKKYLTASNEERLLLLAGIIDSDGGSNGTKCIKIMQKEDIYFTQ